MGAATYIVLETEAADIENLADGKALSRAEHVLTPLARELGVTPLMDFFSLSTEDYATSAEEFNIPTGPEGPPTEQWFAAEDGLRTVRALLAHVETHPELVDNPDRVLDDLRNFSDVLGAAQAKGLRWHLAVDY